MRDTHIHAQATGGRLSVALNESHLRDLFAEHAVPPPMPQGSKAYSLVQMGFPGRASTAPGASVFTGARSRREVQSWTICLGSRTPAGKCP